MDVRAIILLGPTADGRTPESFGGVPMALLDVLGRPVLKRITDRLARYGVHAVTVIGNTPGEASHLVSRAMGAAVRWNPTPARGVWRTAQQVFSEYALDGADLVLVLRLGPYAEVDYDQLAQTHLDQNGRVTAVTDAVGKLLGIFVVSSSRRNDAAYLLRHQLQEFRTPFVRYVFNGYVNRLASAADLRRLAVDGFFGRAQVQPEGVEVKPGVWVASGARIHRRARLLAPAFVGEHAEVHASAVLTRGGVLEHHTVVDCGTIIDDATLLPYSTAGSGLDIAHTVVGFGRLAHLRRNVELEISDPKLVGMLSAAPGRALGHAAALARFFSADFVRRLLGSRPREATLPETAQASVAALQAADEAVPATDPALTNFR